MQAGEVRPAVGRVKLPRSFARPDAACEHNMLVLVRWQRRKVSVPLSQLTPSILTIRPAKPSAIGITASRRATVSDVRTAAESSHTVTRHKDHLVDLGSFWNALLFGTIPRLKRSALMYRPSVSPSPSTVPIQIQLSTLRLPGLPMRVPQLKACNSWLLGRSNQNAPGGSFACLAGHQLVMRRHDARA